MPRSSSARVLPRLLLAVSAVLVVLTAACTQAPQFRGDAFDGDDPVRPLTGENWNGEAFDIADLEGQITVVFFGYTFCPDVCPFTLSRMKQVYAKLGDRAAEVAVVFVSVDPHRDSVEKLASYVPNFDPRFHGVHLTHRQLEGVKEAWGVTAQYGQPKDGPGTDSFYYVDHTGTYFILDREGALRVTLPPNATADDIRSDVEALLDERS